MRYRPAWLCHSWSVSPAVLSCHLPWVCCPCQREGFITSPCQRTHYFYLPGIGVPLYIVNSCRAFPFIGSHFPYCQDLGFMGSDKEVLQSFHLVVPLFFLSLCYSDLQLSYLTFTFLESQCPSMLCPVRLKMHTRHSPCSFVVYSFHSSSTIVSQRITLRKSACFRIR